MHRPTYWSLANPEANIRKADNDLWNTPMGQTLTSVGNVGNVVFALINSFLGIKHSDGTPYTNNDFVSHFMTAFGYPPYGDSADSETTRRASWDRPTWESGNTGRREILTPGESVEEISTTTNVISKVEASAGSIKYHGWAEGRVYTIEKSRDMEPGDGKAAAFAANNPGRVPFDSEIARESGAKGADAEGLAIFDDLQTGIAAMLLSLQQKWDGMKVEDAIRTQFKAPEGTDMDAYINRITDQAGLNRNTDIDHLNLEQFTRLARAAADSDGWKHGKVTYDGNLSPKDYDYVMHAQGAGAERPKSMLQNQFDSAVKGASPSTSPAADASQTAKSVLNTQFGTAVSGVAPVIPAPSGYEKTPDPDGTVSPMGPYR